MRRTALGFFGVSMFVAGLALAGCGRAVNDDKSPVKAMNLKDGTIETFASEGDVPAGWGVCADDTCSQVPPSVPCQNLGPQVCLKSDACRVRKINCAIAGSGVATPGSSSGSSGGAAPVDPEAPDSSDSSDGSDGSGGGMAAPPDYPTDPVETCEEVCVLKGEQQCDEVTDQQSCAARSDCDWLDGPCAAMPCEPGTACDPMPPCGGSCQVKGPLSCEQLDEGSCGARTDCSWNAGPCPMLACPAGEDDNPACQCKPFCQPGPVGESCASGDQCPAGQYCAFEQGCGFQADAAFAPEVKGTCKPMTETCATIYAPVCGCNGKTYSNACEAAGNGVNVLHDGPCDQPPPPPPGGTCDSDAECAGGQFCAFAQGICGGIGTSTDPMPGGGGGAMPMPAQMGSCQDKPEACPEIWAPVCGCDGKTYGSDCQAAGSGVSVLYLGECETTQPPPAGCFVGGCSGQVCSTDPDVVTTCEWKPEYDCLQYTECGSFGANGGCGWKQTPQYVACMATAKQP